MTCTTAERPMTAGHCGIAGTDRRRTGDWLRRGVVLALVGAVVVAGVSRSREVGAAGHLLAHLRWSWLLVAAALEAASMVVFARIQQRLLRAGNVEVGLGSMTAITLAGNALALTLPGGVAWGATWVFRRLRREGADRPLAGWAVLVAGALGSFALFLVVAAGIEIAGGRGPAAHLRGPAAALAAVPVLAAGGIVLGRRSASARAGGRLAVKVTARLVPHARQLTERAVGLASQVGLVRLGPRGWTATGGLALLNWIDDCACLIACIWAVGGGVPWRGVLVAYGLAQVAASLPVVPGGLGVVEGSLSFFLIAYGMPADSALAAVLLYRVVSFWAVVPVGWGIWGCFAIRERRHDRTPSRQPRLHRLPPIAPAPAPRLEPAA